MKSDSPTPAPQNWGGGANGQMITTQAQLDALLARLADADAPVGLQMHTSPPKATLMEAELHGLSFGLPDSAWYADWADWGQALTPFLEDAAHAKSVYDLKFVSGVLGRVNVTLRGVAFDALLAAYLLNAGRAGYPLADLAADSAGIELLADPDNPQATVIDQACAIHALEAVLTPRLERDGLTAILTGMELPLAPILASMERVGVSINADLLRQVSKSLGEQGAALESEILNWPVRSSRSAPPNSCRTSCLTNSNCPSARRPKPVTLQARMCWKIWPLKAMRSPVRSSAGAKCPS